MRRVELLLVEDDPEDVELTRLALKPLPDAPRLHVVRDGEEALAFLRREGARAGSPRPDLVLLDLNLPRLDGFAVLARLRADPALAAIPVVVLTSSDRDADIEKAYALGANCYVTKPASLDALAAALAGVLRFWCR